MQVQNKRRRLELAFFLAGLAFAAAFVVLSAPTLLARMQKPGTPSKTAPTNGSMDGDILPAASLGAAYSAAAAAASGSRIGTISIPVLHLNAPVVEGVGDADLRRGVGHVPGSANAGGLGNAVLAAHRDTLFRPLRQVREGMEVQFSGLDGTYRYHVDSTAVVAPDRLDVLDVATQPELTLITCYPFDFIGSAPMRFIVKAHLVSALPSPSGS